MGCTRSMEVGAAKPMHSGNTIELMYDRSINTVGGQSCGGTLVTGTAHAIDITVPSSNYQYLIESKGVTSVLTSPLSSSCSDRSTSAGTVTFSSTGTVTLRMLASSGSSAFATTGLAECTFTVTEAAAA
eukprot:3937116-Rhodomonas_salina.1